MKTQDERTDKINVQEELNHIKDMIKNQSERIENLEKQIIEDKKKLEAELEYSKFRCALPTIMDMMKIR